MNRVLIIDDELWVSEVIKNIICWTDYGFCVEDVCHDSLSAMELIREKRPQVLSGRETCSRCLQSGRHHRTDHASIFRT